MRHVTDPCVCVSGGLRTDRVRREGLCRRRSERVFRCRRSDLGVWSSEQQTDGGEAAVALPELSRLCDRSAATLTDTRSSWTITEASSSTRSWHDPIHCARLTIMKISGMHMNLTVILLVINCNLMMFPSAVGGIASKKQHCYLVLVCVAHCWKSQCETEYCECF